ncbi:uncharacterized protein LOC116611860 [Nematostella vectensis]|uniref:uncharacterized protein LOC116611860 n=1 Tax=Nematostella vectensis TaxID=45351 RepID=UPI00207764D5|nr:uncharacterized protein LOC116611860 [Nematostella vectensis]
MKQPTRQVCKEVTSQITLPCDMYNTTYTQVLLVPKVTALAVIPSAPKVVPLWCNPFFVSFVVMATLVTVAVLAVNWDNGDQKDDDKEDENKMSSDMRICLTEEQCAHPPTYNPAALENDLRGKHTTDNDTRTDFIEKKVQALVPFRARCESRPPPVMGFNPVGIHHDNHESSRITLQETVSDIEAASKQLAVKSLASMKGPEPTQPTEKERSFKSQYTTGWLAALTRVVRCIDRLTSSNSITIDGRRLLPLKTAALGLTEFDTALAPVLMFNIRRKYHFEFPGDHEIARCDPEELPGDHINATGKYEIIDVERGIVKSRDIVKTEESCLQMSKTVLAAVSIADLNTTTPLRPAIVQESNSIHLSDAIKSASPTISAELQPLHPLRTWRWSYSKRMLQVTMITKVSPAVRVSVVAC